MPLTTTTPEPVDAATADTFRIWGFSVNLRTKTVRVNYEVGTAQPDNPEEPVAWQREGSFVIPAAEFVAENPSNQLSYYENIKRKLYAKAQELGVFPAAGSLT